MKTQPRSGNKISPLSERGSQCRPMDWARRDSSFFFFKGSPLQDDIVVLFPGGKGTIVTRLPELRRLARAGRSLGNPTSEDFRKSGEKGVQPSFFEEGED